jgi:hypothetical protein
MQYFLYTNRGDTYRLTAEGLIFGGPNHISAPSDQWRAVKLMHVVKTRWTLDIVHTLTTSDGWEIYKRNERFKNGRSQWTLVDIDHGTTRIWASKRVTLGRTL